MDFKKIPWKPILYIGGAFVGYKLILKPIFDKIGLTKSDESTGIDENSKLPGWNINFFAQAIKDKRVTADALKKANVAGIAPKIEAAWGTFNDDEVAVFSEIKKVRTQAELSLVSATYNKMYKKNLFETLRDKLSDGEMTNIVDYTKNLPLYKPKTISGIQHVW